MKNLKIIILTLCFILFFCLAFNCSSSNKVIECSNLNTDSTEYFVTGLMDRRKLKVEWVKEEINKDSFSTWLKNYAENLVKDSGNLDSLTAGEIAKTQYRDFIEEWNKVKDKITTGDKIFYYSTPKRYWDSLAGQDGLVVINNCKVLYILILMQS